MDSEQPASIVQFSVIAVFAFRNLTPYQSTDTIKFALDAGYVNFISGRTSEESGWQGRIPKFNFSALQLADLLTGEVDALPTAADCFGPSFVTEFRYRGVIAADKYKLARRRFVQQYPQQLWRSSQVDMLNNQGGTCNTYTHWEAEIEFKEFQYEPVQPSTNFLLALEASLAQPTLSSRSVAAQPHDDRSDVSSQLQDYEFERLGCFRPGPY